MTRGFDDLGFARPDTARETQLGLPEVVFGPGKTAVQIAGVVASLLAANSGPVLVTRVEPAVADELLDAVAAGTYDPDARLLAWRAAEPIGFALAVLSAGTADGPVAAEATAVATAVEADRHGSSTSGSPACTGCSPSRTCSRPPTPSCASPGWRGRCPASSAGWSGAR